MSWSEFFSMGGYALYVWGSYLAAIVLMGGEVVMLLKHRNRYNAPKKTDSRNDLS